MSYLFPGAVGALPCPRRPVDALEGQDHISSARGVKHKVSAWDVDVQELSGAAGFLCPQDVREHVETCQRAKGGQQLGGESPAPRTGCGGGQLSRTLFSSLALTAGLLHDFEKVSLGWSPEVLSSSQLKQGSRSPWLDLTSRVGSFRDPHRET